MSKSLTFLSEEEKIIVENIINSNKTLIDRYNEKEQTIINPTNIELGNISRSLKRVAIDYLSKHSNIKKIKYDFKYTERYYDCECSLSDKWCSDCSKENKESDICEAKIKELEKPYKRLSLKVNELCNKTKISEDLISSKIFLMRKNDGHYSYNQLDEETNKALNKKILEQFIEQNKEFVEKTILTQTNHEN